MADVILNIVFENNGKIKLGKAIGEEFFSIRNELCFYHRSLTHHVFSHFDSGAQISRASTKEEALKEAEDRMSNENNLGFKIHCAKEKILNAGYSYPVNVIQESV